jgi:2'-5' RNA ligase superfamily
MSNLPNVFTTQVGDYILVYFLDEQPVGRRFAKTRNDWPLHVTLVTWFMSDDIDVMKEALQGSAEYSPALQVVLGEDVQFNADTLVSVVADQSGVAMLHGALLATLNEAGVTLRDEQWSGERYTAHVTHHDTEPVPKAGDVLDIAQCSLVKLLPAKVCEVVQHFPFGAAK